MPEFNIDDYPLQLPRYEGEANRIGPGTFLLSWETECLHNMFLNFLRLIHLANPKKCLTNILIQDFEIKICVTVIVQANDPNGLYAYNLFFQEPRNA